MTIPVYILYYLIQFCLLLVKINLPNRLAKRNIFGLLILFNRAELQRILLFSHVTLRPKRRYRVGHERQIKRILVGATRDLHDIQRKIRIVDQQIIGCQLDDLGKASGAQMNVT